MMATKRLILLRHAKSDWHSGVSVDFDRPLNKRGRSDAPRVGRWMHFHNLGPDVICCSSAARTRETLQLVATELDISRTEVLFMGELYHANEAEIVAVVEQQFIVHNSVMLIGHNPGFELALMHFYPDVVVPPDGKLMTTASIAVLEFDDQGATRLQHHRRPD